MGFVEDVFISIEAKVPYDKREEFIPLKLKAIWGRKFVIFKVVEENISNVFILTVTNLTKRVCGNANTMEMHIGGKSIMRTQPNEEFDLVEGVKFLDPREGVVIISVSRSNEIID
ncbi:hypothetical protein HAX54_051857 [Datura stramonium]|uniref:Uncharacterized protein n=1 Tax=Datura stramonium TaxID=4076 RepID=A0ABS8WQU3_DATST|nr:hypothetical protein [Datura stramonium]